MVDLILCLLVGSPSGFVDILAGEEGTSDYHTTGGCEVHASLAVIIRCGVQAVWPDYRSVHCLPSYLSVHVTDDDFHVPSRAAIIHLLQLRVERLLLVFWSPFVWAVNVDDAVVEETVSYTHLTLPTNREM